MVFPKLVFSSAVDNSRPYGSHRYDVLGLKIQRGLFVYGNFALHGFTALEADPEVVSYCERPLIIRELKPRRVVDFWVQRTQSEELWFLLRPSEFEWLKCEHPPTKAFCVWAEDHGLAIRLYTPESLEVGSLKLRNWGEILRHLCANSRYLEQALVSKVANFCKGRRDLEKQTTGASRNALRLWDCWATVVSLGPTPGQSHNAKLGGVGAVPCGCRQTARQGADPSLGSRQSLLCPGLPRVAAVVRHVGFNEPKGNYWERTNGKLRGFSVLP